MFFGLRGSGLREGGTVALVEFVVGGLAFAAAVEGLVASGAVTRGGLGAAGAGVVGELVGLLGGGGG